MNKKELLKIINGDELGLLSIESKKNAVITADERMIDSFKAINNFIKENEREPEAGNSVLEHQLATRLKAIREDKKKAETLVDYDKYNLLDIEKKKAETVNDILESDDLDILGSEDDDLFDLKNVPEYKERESADFIAHRKSCKDFDKFEKLFKECQVDLASGKRKLIKFTESQIQEESFFVMNGVLLFVEKIFNTVKDKNGKVDGRIRCIFENGTESGMLLRSLGKGLYDNGHAVSEKIESDEKKFLENFDIITKEDNQTGFLYILRSLSEDPKIRSIENLYKIGYSTTPIEERIKNAKEDPTYLMAPVSIITSYECYNFNPQNLERLLHNFFGSACLNLDIFDANGQRYTPREWFIAPLAIIEKTIGLIINGGIVNYRYDDDKQEIVLK